MAQIQELSTMYQGKANSPETLLRDALVQENTVMYVMDGNAFAQLPNLATIGDDVTAETVMVNSLRPDGGYNITRAVEGVAKTWERNTAVARNFTNLDHKTMIDNIKKIHTNLSEVNQEMPSAQDKSKWNKIDELEPKISQAVNKCDELESRFNVISEGLFNDITGNPWSVNFQNLEGVNAKKGIWDKTKKTLKC